MNAEHPPIHLISGQPPGWTNKLIERSATEASFCRSKNWLQITGVETCDTNLSMIIPVHNEKKLLPAVIASLGFINLPFDANINVIFVSNNCTDGSQKIIAAGLNQLCSDYSADLQTHKPLTSDPQATLVGSGHIHNTKFLHYDTQSPGKGNALTIGNEIAVQDHPIAFCVDANNFPEPDALAYLYRDAYEHMIRNPDGTAVLSGRHIGETNMDGVDFLGRAVANAKKITQQNNKIRHRSPHEVTGALMAWDTQWLASVGGFPNTAAMDYGIGAIARYSGRTVAHSQDAVIWGFTPNNFTEKLKHASRSMRGKLQLIDQYPGLRELIVTDEPFWFENKFTNRLADLLHNVKDNPKNFPSAAYQWIIWELARRDGTQEYAQNPENPSWDIITSTK